MTDSRSNVGMSTKINLPYRGDPRETFGSQQTAHTPFRVSAVLYQPSVHDVTKTFSGLGGGGGGVVCSQLRAKDFTWIPPVGLILVFIPRFDRDFVITFQ